MKELKFTATHEQTKELEGLAYWIADYNYISERYGQEDPEIKRTEKTINLVFDNLDRLGVPFWVQNTVIAFSENWRRYKEIYMSDYLKTKNIITA